MTKPDHHLSADSDLADRLDAIFDRIEVSCDWRLSSEERQQIARAANALRPQPRLEAGPSNWRELEGAQLPDMKSGVKAPFHFRRYVNGVEMAEDVEISNASTVQEAFAKARALYGTPRGMDLVLTINEPQTVSEWRPIATAPEVDITQRDPETVLLWVADGGHGGKGTHAFGRCYKSHDGSIRAVASGFHGNWNITHWSPLSRPQSGSGQQ
jgi:hypothetical protein